MTTPTEQLHNDMRKEQIIDKIKELALQLDGDVSQSSFLNMKQEWRRITIDYDRKDRKK